MLSYSRNDYVIHKYRCSKYCIRYNCPHSKRENMSCRYFICIYTIVFSSPELKAQVSYSDHPSVVFLSVCLSVRPSVCNLFTFSSSSPDPLGHFQPNLAQSILGSRGIQVVQMKGPAHFQGKIITKIAKIY